MRKKKLIATAAVMLTAVMLAGCGTPDPDPNSGLYEAVSAQMMGMSISVEEVYENGVSFELQDGGKWELVEYRHSPAVATMSGLKFREHEFEIHPGDSLFVYTDGVPEATREDHEMYGTDRMLEVLNRQENVSCEQLLASVKEDIDSFVEGADQFDDITMMTVSWRGEIG